LADNPLLPQQRLRDLHALMGRIRSLDRRRSPAAREALLAATMLHLGSGDLVSAVDDPTVTAVSPESLAGDAAHTLPANLRLPLCVGAARGMQTAATDRLAIAFAQAGDAEPGWADALQWALRDRLPFLLIVAANGTPQRTGTRTASRSAQRPPALTWTALTKLARPLHLPHFPVDGEDAVAVYRVVQETAARARSGNGPSVLWAMLNARRPAARQQPLARLEAYMAARNIEL
jgi:pyruvate dehydrogenase E1 component alpha subunit